VIVRGIGIVRGIVMAKVRIMEESQRKDKAKMQMSQETQTKTMKKTST
jgi:hypothetical protein